jgi:hypothetical protein
MVPTLEVLSKQIAKDLKGSRLQGKSSPDNPVNAETICNAYATETKDDNGNVIREKWEITDREVRAATKFLNENKIRIGSTLKGYYYVLHSSEWKLTYDMLMPKFLSIKSKIDLVKEMENEMIHEETGQTKKDIEAQKAGQEQLPLIKLFDEQLGIEKV